MTASPTALASDGRVSGETRRARLARGAPRPILGRELVRVDDGPEAIVGYVAGWAALVHGRPVGLLRRHPREARRDLLEHNLERARTPEGATA